MTQTEARPFMQVSVQIDTPDAPTLDGKPVRLVSWTATRYDRGNVAYTIYAHHQHVEGLEPLTTVLHAESLDPAAVPAWVPWPPANWLASLELPKPEPVAGTECGALSPSATGGRCTKAAGHDMAGGHADAYVTWWPATAAMCAAIDAETYHAEHFAPGVWK